MLQVWNASRQLVIRSRWSNSYQPFVGIAQAIELQTHAIHEGKIYAAGFPVSVALVLVGRAVVGSACVEEGVDQTRPIAAEKKGGDAGLVRLKSEFRDAQLSHSQRGAH